MWAAWALAVSLLGGCPAYPVETQLRTLDQAYGALGLMQVGFAEGRFAGRGEKLHRSEILLVQCYQLVVLGEPSLAGLEVEVRDPEGRSLGTRVAADGVAALRVCPEMSGDHDVVVRADGPGRYRVAMWGRADDSCADVRELEAVATGDGTVRRRAEASTDDGLETLIGSCLTGAAPEHVYALEVEERSWFEASLEARYDAALYLLTSCGPRGAELACNDDWDASNRSRLVQVLEPNTYFLVVDGYAGMSGDYALDVRLTPESAFAEACGVARALEEDRPLDLAPGTRDLVDASCDPGGGADTLVRLRIDEPSIVTVAREGDAAGRGALVLRPGGACAGDPPSGRMPLGYDTEIACGVGRVERVLEPGDYLVQAEGRGPLRYTRVPVARAEDRAAAGACGETACWEARLDVGVAGDTRGRPDRFRGGCVGAGSGEEIYRVTVPRRSRLEARVFAAFDAGLYLLSDCDAAGPDAVVACNDDWLDTRTSHVEAIVEPGDYHLVVDGFDGEEGTYVLDVALAEPDGAP